MTTVSFDHVGLSVADLDLERRFYIGAFAFVEQHHTDIAAAHSRMSLLRTAAGAALELTQRAGSTPKRFANALDGAGIQGHGCRACARS
jgi:catechol 2,3-dioxygenase-like lactoylglutathione lyase family enzyme